MDLVPKFLLLLICLGHIQEVRGYICAVGRERDEYKVWRWVLPLYAYPCGCTRVIMGGMITDTPKRHFRPVYVDKPLLSDHVGAIRTHYGLQCYKKAPNFEYCPADQSMSTDPSLHTAMATWDKPEAYDILGDKLAIICSKDSGSHFQIGETNVTCKATDKNVYTTMCNFTIAVKDREAPIFTNCTAIRTSEPTLPETTAVVENPRAIDNSGQAPYISCNKEAGYKFPVGDTEVICEASDESENIATCNVIVHIIDPEEPAFSVCPETQTNTTWHGQSFGVVEWNHPLATDNSGDTPKMACDVESGSNFTIGRTDVICMANDASGNQATCNFTVSIIDTEAPVFTLCPANRTLEPTLPETTAEVVWENPEAVDNSEKAPSVSCNKVSSYTFPVGETKIICESSDASENIATCNFTVHIIDPEEPAFIFCPETQTNTTLHNQSFGVVAWNPPLSSDNSGDTPNVTCDVGSGSKFTIGRTDVICMASDASGNKATCNFTVSIIDPEQPAFSFCPETQTNTTLHGQSFGVVTWNHPRATDNSGDTPSVTCNVGSGSTFTIGRTDVTCMASDASGNQAMCNFTVSIIDPEQPAFTFCPETQTNITLHGQSFGVVEWNHPRATDNSGDNTTVTCDVESGSNFTIGRTDVTCMASDASGNKATCNFTVSIIDPEEPAFSFCPETQTNTTLHGQSFGEEEWNHPVAIDNSGDTPNVTCDVESGSNFTIGRTYVICIASDASGNKATCNFTVSIIDSEEPSFSFCPDNQTHITALGQSTSVIQWPIPVAIDNSGDNPTVTCDVESGFNFAIGKTEVTCTSTDASGNKATCNFTVNIMDPEKPAFSFCPDNQTHITALGESTSVIEWPLPVAFDNSGDNPTVTCNVDSGFNFAIGKTEVTCRATDASGNRATCNFTVNLIAFTGAEINLIGQPTSQSSNDLSGLAVDGNSDGKYGSQSCTHTGNDINAWWWVDQGTSICVGHVVLYNRVDCCKERLLGATVRIGNEENVMDNPACPMVVSTYQINAGQRIRVPCNLVGRYISVKLPSVAQPLTSPLTLCEVKAYRGVCATGRDSTGSEI